MPTTTSTLLSKAIALGLDETERSMVSPQLLAQLAIGGHITLTPSDRRRMPKTILALLATGGFIELTRYERDSFNQHTLALLAVGGRTTLQATEFIRLSPDLQSLVKRRTARVSKDVRKRQDATIEADLEVAQKSCDSAIYDKCVEFVLTKPFRNLRMGIKTVERVCVVAALLAMPCTALAENAGFDAEAIQEFLHRSCDGKNAGMVIGVVDEHASQVFGAGKLDNGTDDEVNGDTLFEIGSITKTFTVLLLEDMVNRGEMKLDDPVEKYLPESVKVPSRGGKKITLLNLAAQDSGLPHDGANMVRRIPNNMFADYTADNLYEFLSSYTLTQDPGASFRYSNAGIALLGNAIERKTGRDFESLVRERICTPLHMDSTYVSVPPELKPRLATGHLDDGNRHPGMILQVIIPAGGLHSSANDMLKYVSANIGLQPNPLTPLMQKTHPIRHAESNDPVGGLRGATAMPWYDDRAYQTPDMDFRGHGGGTAGAATFIGFDLKRRRGVVVLSNSIANRSPPIGWRILQNARLKQTGVTTATPIIEIVGIGTAIAIDAETKTLRISSIVPNSPAAEAGIASGLIIQKIDDSETAGLSLTDCMKLLKGPAGSKVRLALVDTESKEPKSVELVRKKFLTSS